ncbi:hypothetical protein ACUX4R_28750, partial [Salmonella enterica]
IELSFIQIQILFKKTKLTHYLGFRQIPNQINLPSQLIHPKQKKSLLSIKVWLFIAKDFLGRCEFLLGISDLGDFEALFVAMAAVAAGIVGGNG